jgi:hypothetical protein
VKFRPTAPNGQHPLHAQADKIEPRLSRAIQKAFDQARGRIDTNALAAALGAKDVRRAMRVLGLGQLKDDLVPAGEILKDAFAKGGALTPKLMRKPRQK